MPRLYLAIVLLLLSITISLTACGGSQPAPTSIPTLLPPPTQPAQPAPSQGWVQFSFPPEDSAVPNPVIVEGFAAAGAQVVRIQIKDAADTLLGEQVVTFSEQSQETRGFSVQISYSSSGQRTQGVIEAYFNEGSQPVNELSVILSP